MRPLLRYVVWAAIGGWGFVLLALLWLREGVPAHSYLSVLFFIALFGAVLVFYNGMTITADRYGITYRGLLTFRTFPYETILKLDVRPGLTGLVTYDVFTKRGLLQFSNFIEGHQRLRDLIVDRAGLAA